MIVTPPDGEVEMANAAGFRMIVGDDGPADAGIKNISNIQLQDPDGIAVSHRLRPGIRALGGLTTRNQQLVVKGMDGNHIPVLIQATPLYDDRVKVTPAVLIFQDVTKLREAEQLKDECCTALTTIHGGPYLLASQDAALGNETRQDLLADIVIESERLDRMLANLLSLSAIMAGRLTAATEPILIGPLARGVIDEVSGRSPSHEFVLNLSGGLPPVEADPDLLSQVLRNLCENTVKYAPDGGEIRTTGLETGTSVSICIRDQGIGIAEEYVNEVFERFRRPGAEPTVRGMGLGLYLSRHLVEAQAGSIHVGSPGPGKGATFSVELPVATGWASSNSEEWIDGQQ